MEFLRGQIMSSKLRLCIGIIPSLESLVFFSGAVQEFLPHIPKIFTNYGELVREMLTGQIERGLLPWEIFVNDIFALPQQRTQWRIDLFIQENPTQLVLSKKLDRSFNSQKNHSHPKIPSQLILGIENHCSLTRHQFHDWILRKKLGQKVDVRFQMLPFHLMARSLANGAIDAYVVPSPWAYFDAHHEVGSREQSFRPENYTQSLVLVSKRDRVPCDISPALDMSFIRARQELSDSTLFQNTCLTMISHSPISFNPSVFRQAANDHHYARSEVYSLAKLQEIQTHLQRLKQLGVLPTYLNENRIIAQLLL